MVLLQYLLAFLVDEDVLIVDVVDSVISFSLCLNCNSLDADAVGRLVVMVTADVVMGSVAAATVLLAMTFRVSTE